MENSDIAKSLKFDIAKFILYLEWIILIVYSLALAIFVLVQTKVIGASGFAVLSVVWPILPRVILPARLAGLTSILYFAILLLVGVMGLKLGKGRNKQISAACLVVVLANMLAFFYVADQLAQGV